MAGAPDAPDPHALSRRGLLRGAGLAAAAPLAGAAAPAQAQMPMAHEARTLATPRRRDALENLTGAESDALEAICARIIPSDDGTPGAAEARAATYIDRALGGVGALAAQRDLYKAGLAAIDAQAMATKGQPFAQLSSDDQDALLSAVEKGGVPGFIPNSAAFFTLMRAHVIQGVFCDPVYGGNADFVGWDMIGYPGIRMPATEADQRLKAPEPVRASAYDDAMFDARSPRHGR